MKISKLITILENYKEKHGDIEVKEWEGAEGVEPRFTFEEKDKLLYISN